MAQQDYDENPLWYVVHTYSGYENKVSNNLETIVENRRLRDLIQEIRVPVETIIEIKDGKEREVERKLFPGYVLIKMIMTDESWYIVRNIRGVTGLVGSAQQPVPLTKEEADRLGMANLFPQEKHLDFVVGDNVQVTDGPLNGFIGVVDAIDTASNKVNLRVSMFGRETPAELLISQVKPL